MARESGMEQDCVAHALPVFVVCGAGVSGIMRWEYVSQETHFTLQYVMQRSEIHRWDLRKLSPMSTEGREERPLSVCVWC